MPLSIKQAVCLTALLAFSLASEGQTDLFPNFSGTVTSPAITHDGSKMAFLGKIGGSTAVYESVNANGIWSEPTVIPIFSEQLGNASVGGLSFNHDGTQLLFHAKVDSSFDLFYVTFSDGKWQDVVKFERPISTNEDEYSPTLSVDNNYIFFLRPKKYKDSKEADDCKELLIYYKNNDKEWMGPNILPRSFNEGCQETPFFCADMQTLFFSSRKKDTTPDGKSVPDDVYNIYYTQLVADDILQNCWLIPQYQGWASTKYDDLSPRMTKDGSIFFKNNHSKKYFDKTYQYAIGNSVKPLPTMTLYGTIKDYDTGEPVKAQINVSDAVTSALLASYSTNYLGQYSIFLNENMNYRIDFTKAGYSDSYINIATEMFDSNIERQFDTTIFSKFKYVLNVYDVELFSPLSPKISVYDSASNQLIIDSMPKIGNGSFSSTLDIGKIYKFHIECEHFNPRDFYFNSVADIFYNEFEEDIELSPTMVTMYIDVEAGENNDSVSVNVKNLSRNQNESIIARRDKDGNLIVELREGDSYEINVAKKGYTYNNTKVEVQKSKKSQHLNVKLDLLTKDTKMTFNNITFETNSAEINASSYDELNRLIDFLKLNNDVRIELSAHTDDVGSDLYNIRLSEKRSQSVTKYLTDNGIPASQLTSKGYGESQPLVPNTSDENRSLNRRVEVKIIE